MLDELLTPKTLDDWEPDYPVAPTLVRALIAELRASRKVVRAARAVFDGIYNEAIGSDEVFSREMALKDALAELSSINVVITEGKDGTA